mgnify:FL=1
MAEIEIRLPKMGESVTEATITNWLKQIGDQVALDEPLVEVATDKVDNELPSEAAGVLIKQLFQKDEVAQVGDVIAILSTDSGADNSATKENKVIIKKEEIPTSSKIENTSEVPKSTQEKIKSSNRFYSPLVKSIAAQEGINQEELDQIQGTGAEGRVTKKDILAHLSNRTSVGNTAPINPKPASEKKADPIVITPSGSDEIIEIGRAHV